MSSAANLPDFHFDICSGYKFNTKVFVSRLGETARKCVYFVSNAASASKDKANNKPKSKAKKKGKAQDNKAFIALGEFPALENTIAENHDSGITWGCFIGVEKHHKSKRRMCRLVRFSNL
jgi:hypothetical protein